MREREEKAGGQSSEEIKACVVCAGTATVLAGHDLITSEPIGKESSQLQVRQISQRGHQRTFSAGFKRKGLVGENRQLRMPKVQHIL